MNSLSATEARKQLYNLLDEAAEAHEPVLITGPRNNAVLVWVKPDKRRKSLIGFRALRLASA